jgi:hypothetical protein
MAPDDQRGPAPQDGEQPPRREALTAGDVPVPGNASVAANVLSGHSPAEPDLDVDRRN